MISSALELSGWPHPKHLAGRAFAVVVHGDVEGVDSLRTALTDWLSWMTLEPSGAVLGRYVGYWRPNATGNDDLDADTAFQEEVRHAARSLIGAVRLIRSGRRTTPDRELAEPRQKWVALIWYFEQRRRLANGKSDKWPRRSALHPRARCLRRTSIQSALPVVAPARADGAERGRLAPCWPGCDSTRDGAAGDARAISSLSPSGPAGDDGVKVEGGDRRGDRRPEGNCPPSTTRC
jgi:hypothetical protein